MPCSACIRSVVDGPCVRAYLLLLQLLHAMGDIQPGVSGVSVFKPVEGVKAVIVQASPLQHDIQTNSTTEHTQRLV